MPDTTRSSSAGRSASARSRIARWSLAVAWAALIFAVSSVPGSGLPGGYATQAHLVEYAILAALVYRALRLHVGRRTAFVLAVVLASCYGITDELHQSLVPLREPDILDWLVDTIGAVFGAGSLALLEGFRSGSRTSG